MRVNEPPTLEQQTLEQRSELMRAALTAAVERMRKAAREMDQTAHYLQNVIDQSRSG